MRSHRAVGLWREPRTAARPALRARPGARRCRVATPARRCATRSSSRGRPSGSATTATGSPSTTTCPASPARRRRCSSPTSPATPTIRLGSGGVMLPEPRAAGRRRAVRHARGAAPRPHRPRHRPRAGHRSRARRPRSAAPRACRRRRLPGAARASCYGFFNGAFPDDHPYRRITAVPARGNQPAIWLLGSSDYSARLAGLLGLPFSFAHHFASANTLAALDVYRRSFRPSDVLDEPYVMLGVAVLCADTDERATCLASRRDLAFLRLRTGRPGPTPRPEEAAAFHPTPHEKEVIRSWSGSRIVGDPAAVRGGARRARRAHRRRRADGHDDGPRPGRPGALLRLVAEVAGLEPSDPGALRTRRRSHRDALAGPLRGGDGNPAQNRIRETFPRGARLQPWQSCPGSW